MLAEFTVSPPTERGVCIEQHEDDRKLVLLLHAAVERLIIFDDLMPFGYSSIAGLMLQFSLRSPLHHDARKWRTDAGRTS